MWSGFKSNMHYANTLCDTLVPMYLMINSFLNQVKTKVYKLPTSNFKTEQVKVKFSVFKQKYSDQNTVFCFSNSIF